MDYGRRRRKSISLEIEFSFGILGEGEGGFIDFPVEEGGRIKVVYRCVYRSKI